MLRMHVVCPLFFYVTIALLMSGDITKKRVVVFGIFDGVHEGHRDLFRQAREYGDELVVIVGRDKSAILLKSKEPRYTQDERLELVKQEKLVDEAVLGDEELSSYDVLKILRPQVICIGYDQDALESDLRIWVSRNNLPIEFHRAEPYQRE